MTVGHAAQDDVEAERASTVDEERLRPGLAPYRALELLWADVVGVNPERHGHVRREQRGAGAAGVVLDQGDEGLGRRHGLDGTAAKVATLLGQGEICGVENRVGAELVAGGLVRQTADAGFPAGRRIHRETE